jgi:hypothetical protein
VRAHEESAGRTDAPAAKRSPSVGTAGQERILELQRAIGNDAVSWLIEQQDQTVHSVLNAGGRPLDESLRHDMESRLGADFSDVRLHTGAEAQRSAREIGARAYTSGDHVVIGDGGADPHTLAHELTHVIQQRQGPVDGTVNANGLSISDPADRFEQAAESAATRAMRGDRVSTQDGTGVPSPGAVQRALRVGAGNLTGATGQGDNGPADAVWAQIAALPAFATRSQEDQEAMRDQFWKWVRDEKGTPGEGSHPVWGRKSQDRVYDKVADLELALHGWVAAKPARREEKAYAEQIRVSPEVEVRLNSILYRIRKMIDDVEDDDKDDDTTRSDRILEQLSTAEHVGAAIGGGTATNRPLGWYQYHLRHQASRLHRPEIGTGINGGVLDVLENPENYNFRDKVVAVHDLTEYFGDQRPWNPRSQGSGLVPRLRTRWSLSTADITDGVRQTTSDRGRTAHQGTRNEQAPTTRFARRHGIPVWSGSSNTAVHMLAFARWVAATKGEMTALAHSIFAFWRVEYDHTSLAPHTLHEVMDVAQNFGIPYDPMDRYADLGHQNVAEEHNDLYGDMIERWNALQQRVDEQEDSEELTALQQQWQPSVQWLAGVLNNFDRIPPAQRTQRLATVLQHLARFDLALNTVEGDLASASSEGG